VGPVGRPWRRQFRRQGALRHLAEIEATRRLSADESRRVTTRRPEREALRLQLAALRRAFERPYDERRAEPLADTRRAPMRRRRRRPDWPGLLACSRFMRSAETRGSPPVSAEVPVDR
jgi:hypothetical protein